MAQDRASQCRGTPRRGWQPRRGRLPLLALLAAGALFARVDEAAAKVTSDDLQCLALTVYFEARGEPAAGKAAVAHVVLNRSRDSRFPRKVCDVAYEHRSGFGPDCQFSWACDGQSDRPTDPRAWRQSWRIAQLVATGRAPDPTGGALWFHADYVDPHWSPGEGAGQRIGRHIFFRRLGDGAGIRLAAATAETNGDAGGDVAGADVQLAAAAATTGSDAGGGDDAGAGGALAGGAAALLGKAKTETKSRPAGLDIAIEYNGWNPQRRRVRINGATFREGDWAAPGILVETIMPKGVVLSYDNGRTKRIFMQ